MPRPKSNAKSHPRAKPGAAVDAKESPERRLGRIDKSLARLDVRLKQVESRYQAERTRVLGERKELERARREAEAEARRRREESEDTRFLAVFRRLRGELGEEMAKVSPAEVERIFRAAIAETEAEDEAEASGDAGAVPAAAVGA